MPGGNYSALSGMRSRLEELDRIAADLANVSTAGYKTERASRLASQRNEFGTMLETAVDVAHAALKTDFGQGTIAPTGRDLDAAIDGPGFFVVETPAGERYTRNGAFSRMADGTLVTAEGDPVLGETGPIKVTGRGQITISESGEIRVAGVAAGKLRLVDLPPADAIRESGTRFAVRAGVALEPAEARVVGGSLEGSNAPLVDRMAALTEVSRNFEALQRGISVLYNDIDSRAITELGRR
jgi:flagellar basal-body rod protein FlgF